MPDATYPRLAIITRSGLGPTARLVLLVLDRGGDVAISAKALAAETGLSTSAISATVKRLAADVWLRVKPRTDGGASRANAYRVTPPRALLQGLSAASA